LRDQHSVERVPVERWQVRRFASVLECDCQALVSRLVYSLCEIARELQLSERALDLELPDRRGAYEHRLAPIVDRLFRLGIDAVLCDPQQNVRVE
jgi:hypothetical protein